MSIKNKYYVERISFQDCKEWLLYKHYAKRIPSISYVFGLFDNDKVLQGVCTFGFPPNYIENKAWEPFKLYELNRLVVNQSDKNMTSFFVSQCLKKIPEACVIISYSDFRQGHFGYIYQATNFLYTGIGGEGQSIYIMKDGSEKHQRHEKTIDKSKIEKIEKTQGKARYYFFIGSKKEKKEMLRALRYPILPYPKGENKRYDASYQPTIQGRLF